MKLVISTIATVIVAVCLSPLTNSASAAPSAARSHQFGAGFVLGNPSALSLKYWVTHREAYDVQLSFFGDDEVLFYGDYVLHFHGLFGARDRFVNQLFPYVGVGPVFAFATDHDHDHYHSHGKYFDDHDDKFAFAVRVPFGIEWLADELPLGVGIELAPGMVVMPKTSGILMAGLSLRYYFN